MSIVPRSRRRAAVASVRDETQAKILRVLEGHPFERVGGSGQIKVDVREVGYLSDKAAVLAGMSERKHHVENQCRKS